MGPTFFKCFLSNEKRRTHAVGLAGDLWQQEASEDFLARLVVNVRLELEQRLSLVLRQPDCLEAARAKAQRQMM